MEGSHIKAPGTPLAERLRPQSLQEIIGQQHLLAPGKPLYQEILADRVGSYILWGPPGSGKTSIARLIAQMTKRRFVSMSAVLGGVREIREIVAEARHEWDSQQRRTILFIDEVHHFNKSQQDALLPHVEDGTLTLIGATTENPSFELNKALLSRCRVLVLKPLAENELGELLARSWKKILGAESIVPDEKIRGAILRHAQGDARRLLNILEAIFYHLEEQPTLSVEALEDILLHKALAYDRAGEEHYNLISAFIKSLRGSDPDAALHYLARMLESGEDARFICRRMIIFASEDIGNADPRALQVAVAAGEAFDRIGDAEGWIPMAQCATYLSSAPKSNAAYKAYQKARQDVRQGDCPPVPAHLRNAPTSLMRAIGYGKGYEYPHEDPGHINSLTYLPEGMEERVYYKPSDQGFEAKLGPFLDQVRALRRRKK